MPDIKLVRLPDRIPMKLTISVLPELHQSLTDYARCYTEVYGREESVIDLIPAMLATFIESDREFLRRKKGNKS